MILKSEGVAKFGRAGGSISNRLNGSSKRSGRGGGGRVANLIASTGVHQTIHEIVPLLREELSLFISTIVDDTVE